MRNALRSAFLLASGLELLVPSSVAQTPSLYLGRHWSSGANTFPRAITAGHLNGDGLPDVVTTGGLPFPGLYPLVSSVLLANAPGSFTPPTQYPSAAEGRDLVLADLDGDGELDLVTAAGTAGILELRLGNGAGGFGAVATLTAMPGDVLSGVCAGDLDGDGDVDLACTNAVSSQLSLFLNTGSGVFSAPSHYATGSQPVSLRAADVNGDSLLDLVTLNDAGESLSVFGGAGDGTLVSHDLYVFGLPPSEGLLLADLNGDGSPDYALASGPTDRVLVQFNDGAGGIASSVQLVTGDGPRGLAAADFDLDGLVDLAVANASDDTLNVFLGTGGGSFASPVTYLAAGQPQGLVAFDADADGLPDLAVVCEVGYGVSVVRNLGGGSFVAPIAVPVAAAHAQGVTAGDLDSDGRQDFVVSHELAGQLSVRLGDGTGAFPGGSTVACSGFPAQPVLADVSGDGTLDLVVARIGPPAGSGNVALLVGTGLGTFSPPSFFGPSSSSVDLDCADLNLDGRADVVNVMVGDVSFVLLSTGLGFVPGLPIFHPAGSSPTCLALGDLNGDSRADLVVGFQTELYGVRTFLGDGAGGFGSASPTPFLPSSRALALGDVDADGHLDVVVAAETEVNVLLGDGTGFLVPTLSLPMGPAVSELTLADLNADGHLDIATANGEASHVSVRLNNGAGGFWPELHFVTYQHPRALAAADFDLDGLADLVTTSQGTGRAGLLLNTSGSSGVWTNLRNGLPGAGGVPLLSGTGSLLGGSSVVLSLVNAAPSASSYLLLGFMPLYASFAGGVMVPDAFTAPGTLYPMTTSPLGEVTLFTTWPLGVPPGFAFYTQFWIDDAAGPFGWAASNGLLGVTP
ncbi:MAG: FG-GAP repeat domain-containing protein [Planctomycetota bacterium]